MPKHKFLLDATPLDKVPFDTFMRFYRLVVEKIDPHAVVKEGE